MMKFDFLFNNILTEATGQKSNSYGVYIELAKEWERILSVSGYTQKAVSRYLAWQRTLNNRIMANILSGSEQEKETLQSILQPLNQNIENVRNSKGKDIQKYIKRAKEYKRKLESSNFNEYLVRNYKMWKNNNSIQIKRKIEMFGNIEGLDDFLSILTEIDDNIKNSNNPIPNVKEQVPRQSYRTQKTKPYANPEEKKSMVNDIFERLKTEFPNQIQKIETIKWKYQNAKREDQQVNKLRSLLPDVLENMLRSILSRQ